MHYYHGTQWYGDPLRSTMWLGLWGKTGRAGDLDPRKSRDLPQRPRRLESPLPNRVFSLGVDVYKA